MYNIGELIVEIDQVPVEWIYKHFYEKLIKNSVSEFPKSPITQKFDGRTIRTRSAVARDTNPSLFFYFKNNQYKWHDYSLGTGGDAVQFVATHYSKTRPVAIEIIIDQYNKYLLEGNSVIDEIVEKEIVTTNYTIKPKRWESSELYWWSVYKISENTLRDYNVIPLESYNVKRWNSKSSLPESIWYCEPNCFAYVCNELGVYQIYRPSRLPKYINVDSSYMIGQDQLKFKFSTCAIVSGLKDIMALKCLDLDIEYVASSSESVLLPATKMDFLKSRYKHVFSMLDNDNTGIKSMLRYEKIYRIPYLRINLEVDHAENMKKYVLHKVKDTYSLSINKLINKL